MKIDTVECPHDLNPDTHWNTNPMPTQRNVPGKFAIFPGSAVKSEEMSSDISCKAL